MCIPFPEPTKIAPDALHFIGIDPDTEASGAALWNSAEKRYVAYDRLTFFALFDILDALVTHGRNIHVVIEAGWKNPSYLHNIDIRQNRRTAARIGANVGANHETGRKIAEMCRYLGIPTTLQVPHSSKWTPAMLRCLTGIALPKAAQDVIDAMRLVYMIDQRP